MWGLSVVCPYNFSYMINYVYRFDRGTNAFTEKSGTLLRL